MTLLRYALILLIGCGATLWFPAFAEPIKLGSDDYALLMGTWEGQLVSKNPDGKIRFTTDTQLKVVEEELGKFWIKKNDRKWATIVEIKDGVVILQFGYAYRPFVYAQEGEETTLSAEYDSEFEGYPRKESLVLTKEPAAN